MTHRVSVAIKASLLDVPYMETLVPHMIGQARYDFEERILVIDPRERFTGKYARRERSTRAQLEAAIQRLVDAGHVDRIVHVDDVSASLTIERYFGAGSRVPTHASSGGPIYQTLLALEASKTDYVLQLDCDVFFHSAGGSWVSAAVELLEHDPNLWLAMTHPGPPKGPPGRSMGVRNQRRAKWDAGRGIYLFPTATTRYFLCDRRKLRGRLRPISVEGGCAPLERCISGALGRSGATRAALGAHGSWHLHAWSHDAPFPALAPKIATAVSSGSFPPSQAGNYDLRLDHPASRGAWLRLLETVERGPKREVRRQPVPRRRRAGADRAVSSNRDGWSGSSLAVVIPIRDRAGDRIRRILASLNWQEAGPPRETIVVSEGSTPQIDAELDEICRDAGATLLRFGEQSDPWNKPLALNVGIRAASPAAPFLLTLDADMVLAPNVFDVVGQRFSSQSASLLLCRSLDLPHNARLPTDPDKLQERFNTLRSSANPRRRQGTGAMQAARRQFFFDVRGYDEDLLWWGAMDNDMVHRARQYGLEVQWIDDETSMLHQWHPRKYRILSGQREREQAQRQWRVNHELMKRRREIATPRRNSEEWGIMEHASNRGSGAK